MSVVMAVWSVFRVMMRMIHSERQWLVSAVVYQLSRKSNPVFRMLLLVLNWGEGTRGQEVGRDGDSVRDIQTGYVILYALSAFYLCCLASFNGGAITILTWENVGLASTLDEASSSFSFSTLVDRLEGLDIMLEENTSSRVLLTDGRVLWDLSHPATVDDTLTGGAGFVEMEMDAGVALTAGGRGGWCAGGLGARCLVDLVGAGGWGSAASGSLEVSCRERICLYLLWHFQCH